ncbi:uncharacterized protein B0T23DRAFT_380709 [Neurospora hispaniola]|uniref:Uncharacterized protein n=1 Tax=Neurospora hispaniola TaxID=588809 RepID=A0AAJ0I8F8_9PEZI|nr:hypothetical protein B0T23DRAFT_380709 [Neurospora hispaniola]
MTVMFFFSLLFSFSFPSLNSPNKREHCYIFTGWHGWLVSFLIDGDDRIGWDGWLKLESLGATKVYVNMEGRGES